MEAFLTRHYRVVFSCLMVILVCLSFYLGALYAKQGSTQQGVVFACSDDILSKLAIPLTALAQAKSESSTMPLFENSSTNKEQGSQSGMYLGSKNGTKYYTPNCAGAKRIKPENIIWFQNAEDARLQGYSAAAC